jgi:hypothetical protein
MALTSFHHRKRSAKRRSPKHTRRQHFFEGLEPRSLLATSQSINPLALESGDFNGDDKLDVADIDALTRESRVGKYNLAFDVNKDGALNGQDRELWVNHVRRIYFGDANLDGEFGSSDLVAVFQACPFRKRAKFLQLFAFFEPLSICRVRCAQSRENP